MSRRWWWVLLSAVTLSVLGVAFGVFGAGHAKPAAATGAPRRPGAKPRTNQMAASSLPTATPFSVTTLTGQRVSVPRSGATVILFMSAQCASCAAGELQLAHLQSQLPAGTTLLSLDVTPEYDTPGALSGLAKSVGARWPQAFATESILQSYRVTELDQVAVVSATGHLVFDGQLPSNQQLLALLKHSAS